MFGFEDFDKLIPAIIAVLWIGAQIVRAVSGGAKKAEQGPPVRRPQPGEPRARGPAAAGGPEGGPARGRPADVFEGADREIRDFMDRLREEAEALEAERHRVEGRGVTEVTNKRALCFFAVKALSIYAQGITLPLSERFQFEASAGFF